MNRPSRSIVMTPELAGGPATPQELELPPEFVARYAVEGELGRGASGVVMRALDLKLGRAVAIKFLFRVEHATDHERFLREARLLSRIAHPNVVTLYDFDLMNGHPFLVMELVEGGSLRTLLASRKRLPATEAVALIAKVLDGLALCHEVGVVHRDVKPENVLLGEGGEPKVADLSVASVQEDATRLTQVGGVLGTVRYMAPEQLSGAAVTPAADLHAVGAMLHELLTGVLPYPGPTIGELLMQVVNAPPPDARAVVPELPEALALAVQRALAKNPADRPASARALSEELQAAVRRSRKTAKPRALEAPPPAPRARPARAMRPHHVLAAVLLSGALAGAVLVGLLRRQPAPLPALRAGTAPTVSPATPSPSPAVSAIWNEPELLELEARLDAMTDQAGARRAIWKELVDDVLGVPDRARFGRLTGPHEQLTAAVTRDALLVDLVVHRLVARTAHRAPTPLEVVLSARCSARKFCVDALQLRLSQSIRGLPRTAGLVRGDTELVLLMDLDPAPPALASSFVRFSTEVPHAVTAAVAGGSGAGSRLADVLRDFTDALGWLRVLTSAAQSMPAITAARERLARALAVPGPASLTRARRVTASILALVDPRVSRAEAQARLATALPDLELLGRDLPGNRPRLRVLAASIRRALEPAPLSRRQKGR